VKNSVGRSEYGPYDRGRRLTRRENLDTGLIRLTTPQLVEPQDAELDVVVDTTEDPPELARLLVPRTSGLAQSFTKQ